MPEWPASNSNEVELCMFTVLSPTLGSFFKGPTNPNEKGVQVPRTIKTGELCSSSSTSTFECSDPSPLKIGSKPQSNWAYVCTSSRLVSALLKAKPAKNLV